MQKLRFFMILACLSAPWVARADDGQAENHLVDAAIAYGQRDWDGALALLRKAREQVDSARLSARIERQAALVLVEVDEPVAALEAFRLALRLDPRLELDGSRYGPGVRSLFACAQELDPNDPPVSILQGDGPSAGWICPKPDASAGGLKAAQTQVTTPPAPDADTRTSADTDRTGRAGSIVLTRSSSGAPSLTGQRPMPPQPPEAGKLSALGGIGIGLLAAGLVAGGGVYAWQRVEARQSAKAVAEIRAIIANIDDYEGDTLELVRRFNDAESARSDHELIANIALGVGSGLVGLGVTLLLIDLLSDAPPQPRVTGRPTVILGPGFASVQIQF